MKPIVCFGEMMVRFAPPGQQRLAQSLPGALEVSFAGAEANIAAAVALLGGESRYVSALPQENVLADAGVRFLRGVGVGVGGIVRNTAGRMPVYYIESGAAQRSGTVLYDREFSAFSRTPGSAYDWDAVLDDASWLVLTGISPALSATAAEATATAARAARERGIPVCCDLNFRAKLWQWEPGTPARELARREMQALMPQVDLLLTNPDQAYDVLGIPWEGRHEFACYTDSARRIAEAYPHLRRIVFTLRESLSASHNNTGAMLYEPQTGRTTIAPWVGGEYRPYEVNPIIDRIGAGDAFAGAYLYALQTPELEEEALGFGVAAACLAHSIPGDVNFVTRAEVEALLRGDRSGRIVR